MNLNRRVNDSGIVKAGSMIDGIMAICESLQVGKGIWNATIYQVPVILEGKNGMGVYVNMVGILIKREKMMVEPKGWVERMKMLVEESFSPLIVLPAFFEQERVRSLHFEVVAGKHVLADANSPWAWLYREELNYVIQLINQIVPCCKEKGLKA